MSSPEVRQQGPKTDYYDQLINKAERSFDYRAIASVAKQCIDNFPKQITEQQFQELSTKLNNKITTATALRPETATGKIGHWLMELITPDTKAAAQAAVEKLKAQPKKNAENFLKLAQKLNDLHEKTDWLSNWRKGRLTRDITELTMYVLDKPTLSTENAIMIKTLLFKNYSSIEQAFTENQRATAAQTEKAVPAPKDEEHIEDRGISAASKSELPPIDKEKIISKLNNTAVLAEQAAKLATEASDQDKIPEAKLRAFEAKTYADNAKRLYESLPNPSLQENRTFLLPAKSNLDKTLAAAKAALAAADRAESFAKFKATPPASVIAPAEAAKPAPRAEAPTVEASNPNPSRKQASRAPLTPTLKKTAAQETAERLLEKRTTLATKLTQHKNESIRLKAPRIVQSINQNSANYSEQKLDLMLLALDKITDPNPKLISDLFACRDDQIALLSKALNEDTISLDFIDKILKAPPTTIEVIGLASTKDLLKDTTEKLLTLNETQIGLIKSSLTATSEVPDSVILDFIDNPPSSSIIPLIESAVSKTRNVNLPQVISALRELREDQIEPVKTATQETTQLSQFADALTSITSQGKSSPLPDPILESVGEIAKQATSKTAELGKQAEELRKQAADLTSQGLDAAGKLASQGFGWLQQRIKPTKNDGE